LFRNDKIYILRVQLAQITKEICRGFAQVLSSAQAANRREIFSWFNRIPCEQSDPLIFIWRKRIDIFDQS